MSVGRRVLCSMSLAGCHPAAGAVREARTTAVFRFTPIANSTPLYGYSYILTNLDVSTPAKLVEVEHRHRTDIEALNKDAKHGAALRHLPSNSPPSMSRRVGHFLGVPDGAWTLKVFAVCGPPGMIVGRFVVVFAPRLPRQAPPAALPSRTRPGGSRSGLGPEDASLLLGRIFGWP